MALSAAAATVKRRVNFVFYSMLAADGGGSGGAEWGMRRI